MSAAFATLGPNAHLVRAADWPGDLRGIDSPGLYGVWVDEEGAKELSKSIGLLVEPGRIYIGEAGATRGMRIPDATLRVRIDGKHLQGRRRISTLRHTLAAALSMPNEDELSRWMRAHLSFAVYPFHNRTTLASLEQQVREIIDPPFNLSGVRNTPVRDRLSQLRKALGRMSSAK